MDKQAKDEFIRDAMEGLRMMILSKVSAMPEDWGGAEIRQYIADMAADYTNYRPLAGSAKRKYKNDVLVNNL